MLFTKKSVLLGDQPLKTILTEHHFFGRPPRLTGSSFFICGPRLQMSLPLLSLRQSVFTFLIRGRCFLKTFPTPPEPADFALPFLWTGTFLAPAFVTVFDLGILRIFAFFRLLRPAPVSDVAAFFDVVLFSFLSDAPWFRESFLFIFDDARRSRSPLDFAPPLDELALF